jgi:hypothetical protein
MTEYKWSSESIQVNSITVVKSAAAAELFMQTIYQLWADTIVVSADGVYPKDAQLKELVMSKLQTDVAVPVVVFGASCHQILGIVSKKTLTMDAFFIADLYRFDSSECTFNWDDRMIATFISKWAGQVLDGARRTDDADYRPLYHPDSSKWFHRLIFE